LITNIHQSHEFPGPFVRHEKGWGISDCCV
jgi:hypothetical protein